VPGGVLPGLIELRSGTDLVAGFPCLMRAQ
jgi:hypothetical protein